MHLLMKQHLVLCCFIFAAFIFSIHTFQSLLSLTETTDTRTLLPFLSLKRPVKGYPWHRWPQNQNVSKTSALIELIERINRGDESDKHLFVYIIQDDRVFRPVGNYENFKGLYKRFLPFEEALVEAVSLASSIPTPLSTTNHPNKFVLQDIPIIVDMGDFRACREDFPAFTFSRTVGCNYSFPVMTYDHWNNYRHIRKEEEWEKKQVSWGKKFPYRKKKRKAIWRGTTTGIRRPDLFPSKGWELLPRAQLVRIGNDHPEIIDAAFVETPSLIPGVINKLPQLTEKEDAEVRNKLKVVKRSSTMKPYMKYLAIIDIDGNGWSSRFGMQLCFNSVTIKVQPNWVDYFQDQLEPWEHYIPVHANLSNLVEMVSYALNETNSGRVQSIIRNAQSWCRSHFIRKNMVNDLLWSLFSYQETLQSNDKEFVSRWKNLSSSILQNSDNHLKFKRIGTKEAGRWYPNTLSRLEALGDEILYRFFN